MIPQSRSDRETRFDDPPPSEAAPKHEKSSLLDDFMDIFYAPSKVFARRQNRDFWIPLLIITVLIGLIYLANRDLIEPIMEAEMQRSMARRSGGPQMTPEQMETGRRLIGTFGLIGAFVVTPIMILGVGVILWLVGKFFDSKQTLNAACVVATFAFVPRVVEGVVNRVQGLLIDPSSLDSANSLKLGIGRFLDPDTASPVLVALLSRVDVFTLWMTVLLGIGLAVTGKISGKKAAIAAAIVWFIGALPTLVGALGS